MEEKVPTVVVASEPQPEKSLFKPVWENVKGFFATKISLVHILLIIIVIILLTIIIFITKNRTLHHALDEIKYKYKEQEVNNKILRNDLEKLRKQNRNYSEEIKKNRSGKKKVKVDEELLEDKVMTKKEFDSFLDKYTID